MQEIIIPTHCPACNSVLDIVNDQLFCRNPDCPAKSSKRIEHFAKTLKIKGLGKATIEKLDLQDYRHRLNNQLIMLKSYMRSL